MKQEKTVFYILRLTVTLLLICGAVAAALAGVNAITEDAIAANQAKKTQNALRVVLPDAGDLQPVELTGDTGIVNKVYTGSEEHNV